MLHLTIIGIVCAVFLPSEGAEINEVKNNDSNVFCRVNGGERIVVPLPNVNDVVVGNSPDLAEQKIKNRISSFFKGNIKQYQDSKNCSCSIMDSVSSEKKKKFCSNINFPYRKKRKLHFWTYLKSKTLQKTLRPALVEVEENGKCEEKKKHSSGKKKKFGLNRKEKKMFFRLKQKEPRKKTKRHLDKLFIDDELDLNKRIEKLVEEIALENQRKGNCLKELTGDAKDMLDCETFQESPPERVNSFPFFNHIKNLFSLGKSYFSNKVKTVPVKSGRDKKFASDQVTHISSYDVLKTMRKTNRIRRNPTPYKFYKPTFMYGKKFMRKSTTHSGPGRKKNVFVPTTRRGRLKRRRKFIRRKNALKNRRKVWPFWRKVRFHSPNHKRFRQAEVSSSVIVPTESSEAPKITVAESSSEHWESEADEVKTTPPVLTYSAASTTGAPEEIERGTPQSDEQEILPEHTLEKSFLQSDENQNFDDRQGNLYYSSATEFPVIRRFPKIKHKLYSEDDLTFDRYLEIRHALRNYLIHNNIMIPAKRRANFERRKRCGKKCSPRSCKCWRTAPLLCLPYVRRGQDEQLKFLIKLLQSMVGKPFPPKIDIFERTKYKPSLKKIPHSEEDYMSDDICDTSTEPCTTKPPEKCTFCPQVCPATTTPCTSTPPPCPTTPEPCPTTTEPCHTTPEPCPVTKTCPPTNMCPMNACNQCNNQQPGHCCTPTMSNLPFTFPVIGSDFFAADCCAAACSGAPFCRPAAIPTAPVSLASSYPVPTSSMTYTNQPPGISFSAQSYASISTSESIVYTATVTSVSYPVPYSDQSAVPTLSPMPDKCSPTPLPPTSATGLAGLLQPPTPSRVFSVENPGESDEKKEYLSFSGLSYNCDSDESTESYKFKEEKTVKPSSLLTPAPPLTTHQPTKVHAYRSKDPRVIGPIHNARETLRNRKENYLNYLSYAVDEFYGKKLKSREPKRKFNKYLLDKFYERQDLDTYPITHRKSVSNYDMNHNRFFTVRHNQAPKPDYTYDYYNQNYNYPFLDQPDIDYNMKFEEPRKEHIPRRKKSRKLGKHKTHKLHKDTDKLGTSRRQKRGDDYYYLPEKFESYNDYLDDPSYSDERERNHPVSDQESPDKSSEPGWTPPSYDMFVELAKAVTQTTEAEAAPTNRNDPDNSADNSNPESNVVETKRDFRKVYSELCKNDTKSHDDTKKNKTDLCNESSKNRESSTTESHGKQCSTNKVTCNVTKPSEVTTEVTDDLEEDCVESESTTENSSRNSNVSDQSTNNSFGTTSSTTPSSDESSDQNSSCGNDESNPPDNSTKTKSKCKVFGSKYKKTTFFSAAGTIGQTSTSAHPGKSKSTTEVDKKDDECDFLEEFNSADEGGQVPTTLKMAYMAKGQKLVTKPSPKIYSKVYPDSVAEDMEMVEIQTSIKGTTASTPKAKTTPIYSKSPIDLKVQMLAVCEGYLEVIKMIKAQNQTAGEELDLDLARYCENIISQSFNSQSEKPKKSEVKDSVSKLSASDRSAKLRERASVSGGSIERPEIVGKKTAEELNYPASESEVEKAKAADYEENTYETKFRSRSGERKKKRMLGRKQKRQWSTKEPRELPSNGANQEQIELIKLLKKRKKELLSWLLNSKDQANLEELHDAEYFDNEDLLEATGDSSQISGTVKPKRHEKGATDKKFSFVNESIFPVYAKQYGYESGGEVREVEVLWRKVNEKTHEKEIFKNISVLALLITSTRTPNLNPEETKFVGSDAYENEEISEIQSKGDNKVGLPKHTSVDCQTKVECKSSSSMPATTTTNTTTGSGTTSKPTSKNQTHTVITKPDESTFIGKPPKANKTLQNITRKVSHRFGTAKDIFQEYSIEFLDYAVYILPVMFTILFLFCCLCCAVHIFNARKMLKKKKKKKKVSISSDESTGTTEDSDSDSEREKRRRESRRKKKSKKEGDSNLENKKNKKFWNVLKMNSKQCSEPNDDKNGSERKKNFLRFLKGKKTDGKTESSVHLQCQVAEERLSSESGEENRCDSGGRAKKKEEKQERNEAAERRELIALLEELKKIEMENSEEKKEVKSVHVQYMTQEEENSVFQHPSFPYPTYEKNVFGLPKGCSFYGKQIPFHRMEADVLENHELYDGGVDELSELLPCEGDYYSKRNDYLRHCDFRINKEGQCESFLKIFRDSGVSRTHPLVERHYRQNESEKRRCVFNKYNSISADESEHLIAHKNVGTEVRLMKNGLPYRIHPRNNADLVEDMENFKLNKKKNVRLKDDGVLCRL